MWLEHSNTNRTSVLALVVTTLLISGNAHAQCEIEKIQSSDAAYKDYFGGSVAIDGDRIIVGASQDDDNGDRSGSAYIFKRVGDTWIEDTKLLANDGGANDRFGRSVDIRGDFVIVGAIYRDEGAFSAIGAAYIFRYIEVLDEWVQTQKLVAHDGHSGSEFGASVALSDELAIVGSPGQIINSVTTGAAYAFQFNVEIQLWEYRSKLVATTGLNLDYFGQSVSIDGENVIVGAKGVDYYSSSSGAAYVFSKGVNEQGFLWNEAIRLIPSDGAANDLFGLFVAISGNKLVVGAYQNDNELGSNAGAAFVFQYDTNKQQWIEQAKLIASDGAGNDRFGRVAMEDDTILVGAHKHDQPVANAGGAYAFQYNHESKSWIEHGKVIASDINYGDSFGSQIDISNRNAIVSSPNFDQPATNAGQAFVFNVLANEDNNANGIIDACEIGFADLNDDGIVDASDLWILLGFWGPCPYPPIECQADLFSDGIVNTQDMLILLANWG